MEKTEVVSPAEHIFCMYKLTLEGSFMTSLITTILRGDIENRSKIAKGFPELVEVCNKYSFQTGYWEDLVKRWNSINDVSLKIIG
jgi:hypothetical protein